MATEEIRQALSQYIQDNFAAEDAILTEVQAEMAGHGLPAIQISPREGRLMQVLMALGKVQRVLEIGSLGGYSGVWLARALPQGGRLITIEYSPIHAQVTRASFQRAGLADRTEVLVGAALDVLPTLAGTEPFDMVFIDADKDNYPGYLEWAVRLTKVGGVIVADNVLRGGNILNPEPANSADRGIRRYNDALKSNPDLVSILLPTDEDATDGLAISVVTRKAPSGS